MTALPVPEEQGGFSGSAIDMLVVMKEIGRGLVVEPYLATAFGAQFLKLAGKQESLLEQVATGELKLAARWARSSRASTCSTSRPRPPPTAMAM